MIHTLTLANTDQLVVLREALHSHTVHIEATLNAVKGNVELENIYQDKLETLSQLTSIAYGI